MNDKLEQRPVVNVALVGTPTVQNDPVTADAIAAQFAAFEKRICERAERYSLSWVPGYNMSPVKVEESMKSDLFMAFLTAAAHSVEHVSIEKRDGEWAIWYSHEPSFFEAMGKAPRKPAMRMRDASLLTRQKFMQEHSLKFAEKFVTMCQELNEKRAAAINAGNEALRFLDHS